MMTGEFMQAMADEWIGCNPEAWERMCKRAVYYAGRGMRFSMERLVQDARYEMATNGTSQGFKFNNNARAACARRLIAAHPECERYMDLRKSAVDCI